MYADAALARHDVDAVFTCQISVRSAFAPATSQFTIARVLLRDPFGDRDNRERKRRTSETAFSHTFHVQRVPRLGGNRGIDIFDGDAPALLHVIQ
jgi:hypothetical protein